MGHDGSIAVVDVALSGCKRFLLHVRSHEVLRNREEPTVIDYAGMIIFVMLFSFWIYGMYEYLRSGS